MKFDLADKSLSIPKDLALNQAPKFLDYLSLKCCSTAKARELFSFETAMKYGVLPLTINAEQQTLLIAASNSNADLIRELTFITSYQIEVFEAPTIEIERAILLSYKGDERPLLALQTEINAKHLTNYQAIKIENAQQSATPTPQSIAARFVQALIDYSVGCGASDLQIIPQVENSRIQLRIKGEIIANQKTALDKSLHQEIINRLKIMANLNIATKLLPLDGAFNFQFGSQFINCRLSTMPSIHGECAAIRILGNQIPPKFHELGLPSEVQYFTDQFFNLNEGAILLSGPTGSGKTTTLYAIASYLAARSNNVITVEDPVECRLDQLSQVNLNNIVGLDFPTALKAILRQDPDVIMLGEIRDAASAQIALQAAQTGHRLLSSVHASNCFEVLTRLKDLGLDLLSIAQAVKLIISQRLIPTLCKDCAVDHLQASQQLNMEILQPVGCQRCDYSGFSGRALVCEALWIDEKLQRLISQGRLSYQQLISEITRSNYYARTQDLLKLLQSRSISFNEYNRWL